MKKISNSEVNTKRVLVLDDDASLGSMLKDILEEHGFIVKYVEELQDAIQAIKEFKPLTALIDFQLGDITGIEVIKQLKEFDADLPAILMTAYPSLDLAVEAIHSDFYDFISKPVDTTYLLRSVNKALEKRSLSIKNKELIESLKKNNDELTQLNQMKSKFLSFVSHDLRTPLTSILGYSEFLRETPELSATDRDKSFEAIKDAVERMNHLISDLMDNVSIESGKLRVELNSMDFSEVYQKTQNTFAPISKDKKINLSWEIVQGPLPIKGDKERLMHVLNNLISNALKHTPQKGDITVRISIGDSEEGDKRFLLVEVADTGDGIKPEDHEHIFEQFFQAESSKVKRQGLGLGLSICKEIIQAHEGTIGVYSDGLGKGSTFWFLIPILERRGNHK